MRFEEYIIVGALLAGVLSKHNHRQAALAFCYALIVAIFTYLFPSASVFEHVGYDWWFVACGVGEASIMMVAWLLAAPASAYISLCSTINLMLNILVGGMYHYGSILFYPVYHDVIPLMEILQVLSLFAYSWPVTASIRFLLRRAKIKNGEKGELFRSV